MDDQEILNKLMVMVAEVETVCHDLGLVPPTEVNATDSFGKTWNFEYDPAWEEIDILHEAPRPPITLHLRDAKGRCVERRITDLTPRPEWIRPFLQ